MTRALTATEGIQRKSTQRALWVGSAVLFLVGIFGAGTVSELLAYLLVVAAAFLPTVLWFRHGRVGVPILPAVAALHILYYALPIVRSREDLSEYSPASILLAAATVSLYLLAAALAAYPMLSRVRGQEGKKMELISGSQLKTMVFLGLGLGVLFLGALAAGSLWWLGGLFGLVRAIALTSLVVACYFLGVARGRGVLRGRSWLLAASGLGLAILISWSTLFLIGGLVFLLASSLGYISTRGKIPWLVVTVAVVLVSILHAGKEEIRNRYWQQGQEEGQSTGLLGVPRLALEWFKAGVNSLGTTATGRSALDRASLLQILLRVEYLTPAYIEYMRGDTYLLLPGMLIPRFVDPDKTKSQAGMDLLNIRYGILSVEGAEKTAVGWGLIAEAYANFGLVGVGGVGLLLGLVTGALTRWSAQSSGVSVSTLLAIAVMAGLINLEQDLSGLLSSLMQSTAAVFVFAAVFRLFPRGRGLPRPHTSLPRTALPRQFESSVSPDLRPR